LPWLIFYIFENKWIIGFYPQECFIGMVCAS
jgi:hypothetical protein